MGQQEPRVALRNILFLILVLPMLARAQNICNGGEVRITENNPAGAVVTTIETISDAITLAFLDPPLNNPFDIVGKQLIAKVALDYETELVHIVRILCTNPADAFDFDITVIVHVVNVNDEPPRFPKDVYNLDILEFTPVNTPVGTYAAHDKDSFPLFYNLISEPAGQGFELPAVTSATIVLTKTLEYDVIKSVKLTLYAQDSQDNAIALTGTTTILVSITDVDNRPPWFQPCIEINIGLNKICQSSGYTGSVNLTEQGALLLKPGPIRAVDGDNGINEAIRYSILNAKPEDLFAIDENSGSVTMTRPVDVLGPIILTVVASQAINEFQFATTTVTIQVGDMSKHVPVFEETRYSGLVSGVGSMVLKKSGENMPMIIRATDADFADGVNPKLQYEILGTSNFSLIGGYLFMMKESPLGDVLLEVQATDATIGDVATAVVEVEITSGLSTTSMAPTTISTSTPQTTGTAVPTTDSSLSTLDSVATDPSIPTTQGSSTHPHTGAGGSGEYGSTDMAILGATLAALLLICLGIIGFLAYRIQKGKAAWGKLFEASVFRSALGRGPGGPKDGVQYTNEAFKHDEDTDSTGLPSPTELRLKVSPQPVAHMSRSPALEAAVLKSTATLLSRLPEDEEEPGTSETDSEKGVKPILTKERRTEDGYKSVWFKEDIVPDAKEDVRIIPDSGEQDAEEDDDGSSVSGNEEDPPSRQKVLFSDADVDSGLGVKGSDSASDAESVA